MYEQRALRLLMVWTRPNPGFGINGRDGTIRAIREVLGELYVVKDHQVHSSISGHSGITKIMRLLTVIIKGIAFGRPLQEAIFSDRHEIHALMEVLTKENPDMIYFDTVRCAKLVMEVRRRKINSHIIVDFDDLMSRRYHAHSLHVMNHGLQLGFLEKGNSSFLVRILGKMSIARFILEREAKRLGDSEIQVASAADQIILVSCTEAKMITDRVPGSPSKVSVLPPIFRVIKPAQKLIDPIRCIFIGSDAQLQNALAIDYLVEIWRKLCPCTTLVIYGNQMRSLPVVRNVYFNGFEPDFDRIYTHNSIALVPAQLVGGVKTKVLEALSYGVPVVANDVAVDGLPAEVRHLGFVVGDSKLYDIINSPQNYIDELSDSCEQARAILIANAGYEAYRRKVNKIFDPSIDTVRVV